jgi:hypothetical protein
MLNERSDIEKRFHAMKEDLVTRLQNACSQRDDARGQVLELQAEQVRAKRERGSECFVCEGRGTLVFPTTPAHLPLPPRSFP